MPLPRIKVIAAHLAPVWLDAAATVNKACDAVEEAARQGATLIAFPESFVPGFPAWTALAAPILTHEWFTRFAAQSIRADGPEVMRLRQTARRHGIHVSFGFSEATEASLGCLWNSNMLVGPDGRVLNHRRKLVPTYYEKLVWAPGDAEGMRVVETAIGRIGTLICGENTNPLARFALMAEGEQLHLASFPPIWPTRLPGEAAAYDIEEAIRIRCGAHSFEAKCFTLVASSVLDATAANALSGLSAEAARVVERTPRAVSLAIGPDGRQIGQSQRDEGLLAVEMDLADLVEPKQFHDVVGYYNRFDIFHLTVDRTRRDPIRFHEEAKRGRSYPELDEAA